MADRFRLSGGRMLFYEDGRPVLQGGVDPSQLEGLPEVSDEAAEEVFRLNRAHPEQQARMRQQPAVTVTPEAPVIERRVARPAPSAGYAAQPDTSGMLARISGVEQDERPAPDSMHPAIRSLLGAAAPKVAPGMAQEHPAVQEVLKKAGFAASADPEMDDAKRDRVALQGAARLSHAADPMWAALMDEGRDNGSRARAAMASVPDPVEALGQRRGEDAARAKADPNSAISQRARQMVSGGDPKVEASLAGLSAAEVEKAAPLLIKRIEQEMAREEKRTAREDQQTFQAEQNRMSRAQSAENARIVAGNGIAREDRAVAREIAKEDRTAQNKKQAQSIEIEERYRGADKALEALEKEIADNGTWDAFGSGPAVREGLINSYATDMAKMRDAESVAREAEVALERKALGEPNQSLLTRNSTALDVIKKQRANLIERRNEAYRVRGLNPPPLPTNPAASGTSAGQPQAGRRAVHDKSGRLLGYINPDGSEEMVD